ncbi:MAG: hypothetical protein RIQ94_773 [Pseudomonadota bacterium]|jgi:tetratricopeptide (TPR) repeat protein
MNQQDVLVQALENFSGALKKFEQESPATSMSALSLLLARDTVAAALSNVTNPSASAVNTLLNLDNQLHQQSGNIALITNFPICRDSLQPPITAWWWSFEKPIVQHSWDRLDCLWNIVSVFCLTAFIACMGSIVPRFASGGFSIMESFGIIGPTGMVAMAMSQLQGGFGQKIMDSMLNHIGIPSHYQSEVTMILSGILLFGAIAVQNNLPSIAESYYQQGQNYYNDGLLREAEASYKQALSIHPDSHINLAMGLIYESLDQLKDAEANYAIALEDGLPMAFNHLGRLYRQQGNLLKAETLFRMGLQRTKDLLILYHLHRNLGWVLLDQKHYSEASEQLLEAMGKEQQIGGQFIGSGMTHCLSAQVAELQNKPQEAAKQWQLCQATARPETLAEYQWLIEVNHRDIADVIDSSSVVRDNDLTD